MFFVLASIIVVLVSGLLLVHFFKDHQNNKFSVVPVETKLFRDGSEEHTLSVNTESVEKYLKQIGFEEQTDTQRVKRVRLEINSDNFEGGISPVLSDRGTVLSKRRLFYNPADLELTIEVYINYSEARKNNIFIGRFVNNTVAFHLAEAVNWFSINPPIGAPQKQREEFEKEIEKYLTFAKVLGLDGNPLVDVNNDI